MGSCTMCVRDGEPLRTVGGLKWGVKLPGGLSSFVLVGDDLLP